jgi:hypothetical protein
MTIGRPPAEATLYRSDSIQILNAGTRWWYRSQQDYGGNRVWTQWVPTDPDEWELDYFVQRHGRYVDALARNARTL